MAVVLSILSCDMNNIGPVSFRSCLTSSRKIFRSKYVICPLKPTSAQKKNGAKWNEQPKKMGKMELQNGRIDNLQLIWMYILCVCWNITIWVYFGLYSSVLLYLALYLFSCSLESELFGYRIITNRVLEGTVKIYIAMIDLSSTRKKNSIFEQPKHAWPP